MPRAAFSDSDSEFGTDGESDCEGNRLDGCARQTTAANLTRGAVGEPGRNVILSVGCSVNAETATQARVAGGRGDCRRKRARVPVECGGDGEPTAEEGVAKRRFVVLQVGRAGGRSEDGASVLRLVGRKSGQDCLMPGCGKGFESVPGREVRTFVKASTPGGAMGRLDMTWDVTGELCEMGSDILTGQRAEIGPSVQASTASF